MDNKLAHNGVINNWVSLGTKYNIEDKDINVDSKMLLTIINRNRAKTLDILKEYEGAAALLWYFTPNPETLYVFRGESEQTNTYYTQYKTLEAERPLFYLKTNSGIFISSLSEALQAIKEKDDEDVKAFNTNKLIKITNGVIEPTAFKVDRSESNSKSYASTNCALPSSRSTAKVPDPVLLSDEPVLTNKERKGGKIYFWRSRYWRNGHLIGGGKELNKGCSLSIDDEGNPYSKNGKSYTFWNGFLVRENKLQELLDGVTIGKHGSTSGTYNGKLNMMWLKDYIWGLFGNAELAWGDFRYCAYETMNPVTTYANGWISPLFSKYEYNFTSGKYISRRLKEVPKSETVNVEAEIDGYFVDAAFDNIKPVFHHAMVVQNWEEITLDGKKYVDYTIFKTKDDFGNPLPHNGVKFELMLEFPSLKIVDTTIPDRFLTDEAILNKIVEEHSTKEEKLITITEAIKVVESKFDTSKFKNVMQEEAFATSGHYVRYKFQVNAEPGTAAILNNYVIAVKDDGSLAYADSLAKYLKNNVIKESPKVPLYFTDDMISAVLDEILITAKYHYEILNVFYLKSAGSDIERIILKVNYTFQNQNHVETITLCENEGLLNIAPVTSLTSKNTDAIKTEKVFNIINNVEDNVDEAIEEAEVINDEVDYCLGLYEDVVEQVGETLDTLKQSEVKDNIRVKSCITKLEYMKHMDFQTKQLELY
jgi:hypothetical protein